MKTERLRNAPILGKLRFTILVTCATALLCASLALFAIQLHFFKRDFWPGIRAVSQAAAVSASDAISNNEPDAAQRIVQGLMATPHIVSAGIVLNDGSVFAQAGGAPGADSFEQRFVAGGGTLHIGTDFAALAMQLARRHAVGFLVRSPSRFSSPGRSRRGSCG